MKNFFKNFFLPLKVRILIIIIFPVIFYPFIILYFNKYQEILINSEFLAMERQGTTFAKAIGMAEDQYGLIEKNKISGVALQTLLTSGDQNFQLKATLYNTNGNLIADSDTRFFSSKVEISKLPVFKEDRDFNKVFTRIVSSLSKIISQPIDLKKYKTSNLDPHQSPLFWKSVNSLQLFSETKNNLLRAVVPPANCEKVMNNIKNKFKYFIDWSGSLFWIEVPGKDDDKLKEVKKMILQNNGYVTIIKKSEEFDFSEKIFTIDDTKLMISKKIKESFDPKGIFNPGKMYKDF